MTAKCESCRRGLNGRNGNGYSPLLLAENASDVVLQIENAKGLGIDLSELNAGHGVLMPMGLSFEVVSIETLNGKMIYTLKALVN